jgi:putative Mg2+ transporter-C (MgtC) family protein
MNLNPEDFIKLLIALLIGLGIGFEREIHNKSAGLRTITLITLGATLFTILSLQFEQDARVAANIVSGIGFLGAGVILFAEGKVKGLTTASSIWAAAALGMAVGMGQYLLAATAGLMVVLVLWLFVRIDIWLNRRGREIRTYRVSAASPELLDWVEQRMKHLKIHVAQKREYKTSGLFICEWDTRGALDKQEELAHQIVRNADIAALEY